jgi:uncharacterized protein (DUF1330 family)
MAGYWIVKGTVKDQEAYQEYGRLWQPIAQKYGAKFITGAEHETREGAEFARVAVLEFPSYEQAKACYDDADYAVALKFAMDAYDPEQPRELVIVDGN